MAHNSPRPGHDPGSERLPLRPREDSDDRLTSDDRTLERNTSSGQEWTPPIDFGPLKHVNWIDTPLGGMHQWSPCLKSLASLLVTLPYAAAIFWGEQLIMIHNTPWVSMSGSLAGQGKPAVEILGHKAVDQIRATMAGQMRDTDNQTFFESHGQDLKQIYTLLHPLCGDGPDIEGVMAQVVPSSVTSMKGFWKKSDEEPRNNTKGKAQDANDRETHDDFRGQLSPDGLTSWLSDAIFRGNLSPCLGNGSLTGTDDSVGQGSTGTDMKDRADTSKIVKDLPVDGRILFQKFAHMIPTGLAILDSDAEALFVNDLFYKLTTHPGANPFQAWPQSIHPEDYDRVMREYKNAFHTNEVLSTQFRSAVLKESDTPSWRLFMMRPISDRAPVAQDGYICAIIDITSLKAAELYQKRIAAEAIERKSQQEKFIDMISHEIRNPLSAILHCSEGIIEGIRGQPINDDPGNTDGAVSKVTSVNEDCLSDVLEAAETILFCVAHQKNIVDDILSLSKLDAMMLALTPSPSQPQQKFAQYLRIFQSELREKGIGIKFALDPSYPDIGIDWVRADMIRINQVLVNLMTNAIKFTFRKKGEKNITVSLGASSIRPTSYPPSVVFFRDEEAAHRMDATLGPEWGDGEVVYLLVAVRDTGIGISDEEQARLFERFHQATPKTEEQYGGTGLGLFISRKLCQLHGGDIGVSSKKGEGSTFGFFFKVRMINKPKQKEIDKKEADLQDSTLVPDHPPIDEHTPQSLVRPPIESRQEVHPAVSSDDRYERSAKIAAKVDEKLAQESEKRRQEEGEEEERNKQWLGGETRTDGELERPSNLLSSKSQPGERQDESQAQPDRSKHGSEDKGIQGKEVSDQAQIDDKPGLSGSPSTDNTPSSRSQQESATSLDDARPALPKAEKIKPRTLPPRHVLLVEDNIVNQRVLKRHLATKGFRVTTANNGQQAVEAHEGRLNEQEKKDRRTEDGTSQPEDAGQFDIILMDQEMPVMDGNTATKTIRKKELLRWGDAQSNRVPILGISANARAEQREGMHQAGMDHVISKPFAMADLIKQIHRMIEGEQES